MFADYGYIRIATLTPKVSVGDVTENITQILNGLDRLAESEPDLTLLPELTLTGYSCGDLFQQDLLVKEAEAGLNKVLQETSRFPGLIVLGLPLRIGDHLYNCAAVLEKGNLLGLIPKTAIPNHKEFYEKRWFTSSKLLDQQEITLNNTTVPIGTDLLFCANNCQDFFFAVEICEDLWSPIPPSTISAIHGATVLCNLSASNDLIGKADYRRMLVRQQSGRFMAAYAYCSAGVSESTTDLVFGGHSIIGENGRILTESKRFHREATITTTDIDVAYLRAERRRTTSFSKDATALPCSFDLPPCRTITFNPQQKTGFPQKLQKKIFPLPFVPTDPFQRSARCGEIFSIQSAGLATRLAHTGLRRVVIGLSGGLDSTLALLVAVEAFKELHLPLQGILCITMPGFGTSERTLNNVRILCEKLNLPLEEIDITEACELHLKQLGHENQNDTCFENTQARERTQILMNKANQIGGMVIGTGDMSELALGWCTYNGDHMSMYAVNCSIPKTLVAFLIEHVAETETEGLLKKTLLDILDTPISPELLPPDQQGVISHCTEELVGPYELHDFFLFNLIRCGFTPNKVFHLAYHAFSEEYDRDTIREWLKSFIHRFFTHQFKRSCIPDGPKVGTLGLSPRGDWRMPSDAGKQLWLASIPED